MQSTLDSIAVASGSTTGTTDSNEPGSGFMTDLTSLLSAVKSGDLASAKTVADTIAERVSEGPRTGGPLGPPPPSSGDLEAAQTLVDGIAALFSAVQSDDTDATSSAATNLQALLDSLTSNSSESISTADDPASAFLADLQSVLEALKAGGTSESELLNVLMAYKENGPSADAVEA